MNPDNIFNTILTVMFVAAVGFLCWAVGSILEDIQDGHSDK